MGDEKPPKIPAHRQSPPFVPLTGNPENGDYLDWYRRLKEGEVVPFPIEEKEKPPTT